MKAQIGKITVYAKGGMLYLSFMFEGKRKRPSSKYKDTKANKKYVEANKYEIANEWLESNLETKSMIIVDDVAEISIREDEGNRMEDTTNDYISLYLRIIKNAIGTIDIKKVRPADINAIKTSCISNSMSQSTFNKLFRTLNFIFKYAFINDLVDQNVMLKIDKNSKGLIKAKTNRDIYSEDEMDKVIYAVPAEDLSFNELKKFYLAQLFLSFGMLTGLRVGELIPITFEDIDFEKNTISISKSKRHGKLRNTTKTGRHNLIPLHSRLKEMLLFWKEFLGKRATRYIFASPRTKLPFSEAGAVRKRIIKFLESINVPYKTTYSIRHSFASMAASNNIPMQVVQKMLNHKSLSTTQSFYIQNNMISEEFQLDAINSLMPKKL